MQLNQLAKEGEKLMKESEAIAERWGNIAERHLVMVHTFKKKQHKRKCDLGCVIMGLKRKIKEMQKVWAGDIAFQSHVQRSLLLNYLSCGIQQMEECDQVIKELQESKVEMMDKLEKKKKQMLELQHTSEALDSEFINLQNTKERVRTTQPLCTVQQYSSVSQFLFMETYFTSSTIVMFYNHYYLSCRTFAS